MKVSRNLTVLEIGALVCEKLRQAGIEAFLSGGAVVSIYTDNRYESHDLDFIAWAEFKQIEKVMIELGFSRERGRHFIHPHTDYFVEFPGSASMIGDEPIREFNHLTAKTGRLRLLTPTDCIMDRLAAYYHWDDYQGLEQALMVAEVHPWNPERVKAWSQREGSLGKFEEFLRRTQKH